MLARYIVDFGKRLFISEQKSHGGLFINNFDNNLCIFGQFNTAAGIFVNGYMGSLCHASGSSDE